MSTFSEGGIRSREPSIDVPVSLLALLFDAVGNQVILDAHDVSYWLGRELPVLEQSEMVDPYMIRYNFHRRDGK